MLRENDLKCIFNIYINMCIPSAARIQGGARRVYKGWNRLELCGICGQSGCAGPDWEGNASQYHKLYVNFNRWIKYLLINNI